jgi:bacillithiol synthase
MQKEDALLNADCFPISAIPGLHRQFVDFCAGDRAVRPFYAALPPDEGWHSAGGFAALPAHRAELVALLGAQNPSHSSAPGLKMLAEGAGVVVTGQQVGLFGGPLFTPFKAATALARARHATAQGRPHVAVFWLASEDHDFAEIQHVSFPARREMRRLVYSSEPAAALPVGQIALDDSILPLVDQAAELLGASEALDALASAWKPGRTFSQAFADFYARIFAPHGLLILDAGGRDVHRMGSSVLRAAIERPDELHAALLERNRELEAAGYEPQVTVAPQSSLLFLMDGQTGARNALRRHAPSAEEPNGLWQAGAQHYSTSDLLGILDAEPERFSPAALLRPVFADFLLSTSLMIGGPAEVAYLAQSAVLFERILGRKTPVQPRFSATLIEPQIGELLRKHDLALERVFAEDAASLAQLLAARAMPIEGKQRLAAAGNALDAELDALLDWMRSQDAGLAQSAETAAGKMRYQMNRLRNLAANFQVQREASLGRHAEAIGNALYPGSVLQERVHGAAYYFARYGFGLAEELITQAANPCPGHTAMWL